MDTTPDTAAIRDIFRETTSAPRSLIATITSGRDQDHGYVLDLETTTDTTITDTGDYL